MKTDRAPRIMSVEKVPEGLIITFGDCTFALFPASFLHSALPRVRKMTWADKGEEARSSHG